MRMSREDLADILAAFENSGFVRLELRCGGVRLDVGKQHAANAGGGPLPEAGLQVVAPRLGFFQAQDESATSCLPRVGARVHADTVVGFIRVMEECSAVAAGAEGVVIEVLVRDGQFIEFGQPLLRLAIGDDGWPSDRVATSDRRQA